MNNNGFLLSIVIPTKDRYKYLLPMLELLNSYKLKNTEIVIEDNSEDNTDYKRFVSSIQFNLPIVYNYSNKQLPVSRNIDNAILHSSGEYVCLVGDDDGIMPNIVSVVNWMKKEKIDSIRQKNEITYKWPSFADENISSVKGASLKIVPFTGEWIYVNSDYAAKSVVKGLFSSLGSCPCVYQGIISRSALDNLYKIGGTFMPGPSPDMANAMAMSYIVKKHVLVDFPVIISGGSEFQGGKSKKVKKWVQPLSDVIFISKEDKEKWDKRIPYFWCGPTVWPESGVKGLKYVNQEDKLVLCNFDKMAAKALHRGRLYKSSQWPQVNNKFIVYFYIIWYMIREKLASIKHYLVSKGILKGFKIFYGVKNMNEAVNILNTYTPIKEFEIKDSK